MESHNVLDMADETYTKLFSSITRSSIWLEDDQTLRVWVTLLALANRYGYVGASVGGLAATARVSPEKVRKALDKFMQPDPDSRSPEFDGRRIEVADRGWNLLNYDRFRDMRDEEMRKAVDRDRKREQRRKKSAAVQPVPEQPRTVEDISGLCPKNPPSRDQRSEASPKAKETQSARVAPAAPPEINVQGQGKAPEPRNIQKLAAAYLRDEFSGSLGAIGGSQAHLWPEVLATCEAFKRAWGRPVGLRPIGLKDPRLKVILERFSDGCTLAELERAIERSKFADYIVDNQANQTLQTILRDSGQVDKFGSLTRPSQTQQRSDPRNEAQDMNADHDARKSLNFIELLQKKTQREEAMNAKRG